VLLKSSLEKKIAELNSYQELFLIANKQLEDMKSKIVGVNQSLNNMKEKKIYENIITQKLSDELERLKSYQLTSNVQLDKINKEHKLLLIKIDREQNKQ
jgi:hypothetical protein